MPAAHLDRRQLLGAASGAALALFTPLGASAAKGRVNDRDRRVCTVSMGH